MSKRCSSPSDPSQSRSPRPRRIGTTTMCMWSIRTASRNCRTVLTPPPIRTSRSPARARACLSAVTGVGVDEMEGSSTFHFQYRPRMVGQDNDWCVEDRVITPPSLPFLVLPGPRCGPNLLRPMISTPTARAPSRSQTPHRRRRIPPTRREAHLAKVRVLEGPLHEPVTCVAERSVEFSGPRRCRSRRARSRSLCTRTRYMSSPGLDVVCGHSMVIEPHGSRGGPPSRRRRWLRPYLPQLEATGCRSRMASVHPCAPSKGHAVGAQIYRRAERGVVNIERVRCSVPVPVPPTSRHVEGMNCMGPTAWSQRASPSRLPRPCPRWRRIRRR